MTERPQLKSRTGKRINYSPSTGDLFDMCARRGWYLKGQGIPDPGGPASKLGTIVHEALDRYLQQGTWCEPGTLFEDRGEALVIDARALNIAKAGQAHLATLEGAVVTEEWTRARLVPGMPMVGRIDMSDMSGEASLRLFDASELPPGGVPYIGDHKTTSNLNYAKDARALQWNAQMLLYAGSSVVAALRSGVLSSVPEHVAVQHIYYRTKGAPLSIESHTLVPWSNIEKTWRRAEERANRIYDILLEEDPEKVPVNTSVCRKYGKLCPAAHLCSQSPANRARSSLGITLETPKNRENRMGLRDLLPKKTASKPRQAKPTPPATVDIKPPDAAPNPVSTDALILEVADACKELMRTLDVSRLGRTAVRDVCTRFGLKPVDWNLYRVATAGEFAVEGLPRTEEGLFGALGYSRTDVDLMSAEGRKTVLEGDILRDRVRITSEGQVHVSDDAAPIEPAPTDVNTKSPGHRLSDADIVTLVDTLALPTGASEILRPMLNEAGLRPSVLFNLLKTTPYMRGVQAAVFYLAALRTYPEPTALRSTMKLAKDASNACSGTDGWKKIGRYTSAAVRALDLEDIVKVDFAGHTITLCDHVHLTHDEATREGAEVFPQTASKPAHAPLKVSDFIYDAADGGARADAALARATNRDMDVLYEVARHHIAHQNMGWVVNIGIRLRALGVELPLTDGALDPHTVVAHITPEPARKTVAETTPTTATEPPPSLAQLDGPDSVPEPEVESNEPEVEATPFAGWFPVYVGCYPQAAPYPRSIDDVLRPLEQQALKIERNQDGAPVRHWGQFDYGRGPAIMATYLRDAIVRDGVDAVLGTTGLHLDSHHPLRGAVLTLLRVIPGAVIIS